MEGLGSATLVGGGQGVTIERLCLPLLIIVDVDDKVCINKVNQIKNVYYYG
jgi:hypothetical protein